MKNAKQFVLNVKRATGNLKDAVAEAEAKTQKGKNSTKSVKPGTYFVYTSLSFLSGFLHHSALPLSPRLRPCPNNSVDSNLTLVFERILCFPLMHSVIPFLWFTGSTWMRNSLLSLPNASILTHTDDLYI